MERIALVLLAAGKSTRFGRPKQLEALGPKGEWIMELTLRDAFAAGCDEARIVVRPEHEELCSARFAKDKRVRLCVQPQALGTAHAMLVGMEHAEGTCILANADDHYGPASLRIAMEHARDGSAEESALVAFELGKALSAHGPVNRALCIGTRYQLRKLIEHTGLRRDADGVIRDTGGNSHPESALVSMNLWVMRTSLERLIEVLWQKRDPKSDTEFGLPDAVRHALRCKHPVRLLRTTDRWCGLTFPDDAELVRRFLAERNEP